MNKHIIGQDGTSFMVLESVDNGPYKVIAHCPSQYHAESIVEAFAMALSSREDRISYNGR